MDDEVLAKLSFILRRVCATGRPIDDLDEIPSWFEGPENETTEMVQEIRETFDVAHEAGLIHRWVYESRRGPSTLWDWTTTAHRRAFQIGLLLANPAGEDNEDDDLHNEPHDFDEPPNIITTPIQNVRPAKLANLAEHPLRHCADVFARQVRFTIAHKGKPVAALVPLVDLEMLKDLQVQVDPCKWVEWIQDLREQLGWPPVTFDSKEAP